MTTSRSFSQDAEIFQFDKKNVQLMHQNLRESNPDRLAIVANLGKLQNFEQNLICFFLALKAVADTVGWSCYRPCMLGRQ